ncbi:hypothetical protein CHCC20348_4543 [Bacillus paralicheniformis]|nr:hypothetical protein CHCC20348_4543 [Bacillus paralicheniformis]
MAILTTERPKYKEQQQNKPLSISDLYYMLKGYLIRGYPSLSAVFIVCQKYWP